MFPLLPTKGGHMKKVLFILLFVSFVAQAQYIDLSKGGQIIAQPVQCEKGGSRYVCVPVAHEGKYYLVLIDQKGEAFIYELVNEKPKLIWSRDTI